MGLFCYLCTVAYVMSAMDSLLQTSLLLRGGTMQGTCSLT